MSVVVIEDSPTQRVQLTAELRTAGFQVQSASDGEAGLRLLDPSSPPEAVITDILMPGINGYEVCRRIRADRAFDGTALLVLTELTQPTDVLRAIQAGADNYCTKPYTLGTLLERLRRSMDQVRGRAGAVEVDGEHFSLQTVPGRLVDILVSSLSDAASRHHEVERSRAEIARVGNQREEVMRLVVHELRTPLQAMLTAASLAPRDEQVWQDLPSLVTRQGQRISRVLGDLSDLTRIELGRLSVERHPEDLVPLVREAAARSQPLLGGHQVRVQSDPGPLVARIDRVRMEQVLTNLLTNAAKYSPGQDCIDVTVREGSGRARVEVRDYGIGIPQEDLGRVFERYYRAKSGEGEAEGLGIGLFVTRHLVEAHGGSIGVDSEVGRGSAFWFEIPLE